MCKKGRRLNFTCLKKNSTRLIPVDTPKLLCYNSFLIDIHDWRNMTDKEKDLAEKAKQWYSSKDGQESLKKSVEKALENSKRYKMRRNIRPEILSKQITI